MKFKNKITKLYKETVTSLAFIPILMTLGFIVFAYLMILFEQKIGTAFLSNFLSFIAISDITVAQSMLTTLAGGVISMMVFSFSMVMVFFSQVMNNFSPRIIRGLINHRSHQIIIGYYIGFVAYCLILLASLYPKDQGGGFVPRAGVLIGVIFGLFSLAFFVYFIHSISQSIQISNILERLHRETTQSIKNRLKLDKEPLAYVDNPIVIANKYSIKSEESGYFSTVNYKKLGQICQENDIQITMNIREGNFVSPHEVIAIASIEIDKEIEDKILECFLFSASQLIKDNYYFGLMQLSEIAIKALSPSINDPQTAIRVLDYLKPLFFQLYSVPVPNQIRYEEVIFIEKNNRNIQSIFADIVEPIYQYGKQDKKVTEAVIDLLDYLLNNDLNLSEQAEKNFNELQDKISQKLIDNI